MPRNLNRIVLSLLSTVPVAASRDTVLAWLRFVSTAFAAWLSSSSAVGVLWACGGECSDGEKEDHGELHGDFGGSGSVEWF